jgi:hypothetical protein
VPTTAVIVNDVTYNTVVVGDVTYACTGWTGTGSVSASGTATTTTFTIAAASSITWHWIILPASLDVYTNTGGQGWNAPAGPVGPEGQVKVYASLTYGGAPVSQQLLTLNILDGATQIASRTVTTASNGIGTTTLSLPLTLSSGAPAFGEITITSSVSIGVTALNDSCSFMYNYLQKITRAQIAAGDSYGSSSDPSFSRNTGPTVSVSVTVTNINWAATSVYLTATIYDNNNVPVAYVSVPEAITAATSGNLTSANTQTFTIRLNIPTFAFVGPATIYLNLFNGNPASGGTPLCAEFTGQLQIDAS